MRSTLCRLLTAAALAAAPALAPAAAPAPAVPGKAASPMDAARKALDETTDLNYQDKSLNEVIADLKSRTKVAVAIDPIVYQFGLDPNQPVVTVNVKGQKLKDALRQTFAPFNLKVGLTREGLFISTEEGLTAKQLRQRVSVDCDGTPFAAAVKQLATDCGANVVVDPRLTDKANAAVTLKLDDVPLETAVRLLAEVADLSAVRMNNVLFVTTADRAEKLRPSADGPTQPAPATPVFPIPVDRPFPVPGFPGGPGGGVGGAPGVILPAVPEKPEVAPPPPPQAPPVLPPVPVEKR